MSGKGHFTNNNKPEQEKLGEFNIIEYQTFGHVGDVESGVGYTRVSLVDGTPTDSSKSNASLTISNTDSVEASTKVITKTIGATSWTKTLSLNAGGDTIAVSAWLEV